SSPGPIVSSTAEVVEERMPVTDLAAAIDAAAEPPVTVIEPTRGWQLVNFRELWRYRELLVFLTWRDIKVRYKQTVLGAAWAVIQPLATMVIFTFFFGKLARIPTEGVPSPIFFYTALLLWTFFSNGVTNGANSLIGNSNLITKV